MDERKEDPVTKTKLGEIYDDYDDALRDIDIARADKVIADGEALLAKNRRSDDA